MGRTLTPWLGLLLGSCGGVSPPTISSPGGEPQGVVLMSFEPADCRDAVQDPSSYEALAYLVHTAAAELVLVESRAGYPSLELRNHLVLPDGSRVFRRDFGAGALSYRLPATCDTGALELRDGEGEVVLRCLLKPRCAPAALATAAPGSFG